MTVRRLGLTIALFIATGAAQAQPVPMPTRPAAPRLVVAVGCEGTGNQQLESAQRQVRRQGNCDPNAVSSSSRDSRRKDRDFVRRYEDCHRDVRTHRIRGVMVKHRHVGDDCRIREVRTVN